MNNENGSAERAHNEPETAAPQSMEKEPLLPHWPTFAGPPRRNHYQAAWRDNRDPRGYLAHKRAMQLDS